MVIYSNMLFRDSITTLQKSSVHEPEFGLKRYGFMGLCYLLYAFWHDGSVENGGKC